MRKNKKYLAIVCMGFASAAANAGVEAFSGGAGEKVFVERTRDAAYVKLEGVNCPWSGKVIKVKAALSGGGEDRISFEYTIDLSSGKQKRTYQLLVGEGQTLLNGSLVKQERLFCQTDGLAKNGVLLHHDAALTEASQKLGLEAVYKKSPYTPEVE